MSTGDPLTATVLGGFGQEMGFMDADDDVVVPYIQPSSLLNRGLLAPGC